MLTASLGIGGGTVLLAAMAQIIPVTALIPVHGFVQLGSNIGRSLLMFAKLNYALALWFLCGSLAGAALGGQIVVNLPIFLLKAILGGFILFSVWGPSLSGYAASSRSLLAGGFLSTILTMFVGATGPFVVAVLKRFELSPQALVATCACCLSIQHFLKILVFGVLGFAFSDYLGLIILMIVSGFIGTFLGRKILIRVDPAKFKKGLDLILTTLAVKLVLDSLLGW